MNKQIDDSLRIITTALSCFENIQIDKLKDENWNSEYGAYDCIINNQPFKTRLAKKNTKEIRVLFSFMEKR